MVLSGSPMIRRIILYAVTPLSLATCSRSSIITINGITRTTLKLMSAKLYQPEPELPDSATLYCREYRLQRLGQKFAQTLIKLKLLSVNYQNKRTSVEMSLTL